MTSVDAKTLLDSVETINSIINEYLGKEIFVYNGKRLDTIILDKKDCFMVKFLNNKLFSIHYRDDNKYSPIYTHHDGEKAQILN